MVKESWSCLTVFLSYLIILWSIQNSKTKYISQWIPWPRSCHPSPLPPLSPCLNSPNACPAPFSKPNPCTLSALPMVSLSSQMPYLLDRHIAPKYGSRRSTQVGYRCNGGTVLCWAWTETRIDPDRLFRVSSRLNWITTNNTGPSTEWDLQISASIDIITYHR